MMAEPTHRAVQEDGWWIAEFRIGSDWHRLSQRFSVHIGRAETEGYAWAAREGFLLAAATLLEAQGKVGEEARREAHKAALDAFNAEPSTGFQRGFDAALDAAIPHLYEQWSKALQGEEK